MEVKRSDQDSHLGPTVSHLLTTDTHIRILLRNPFWIHYGPDLVLGPHPKFLHCWALLRQSESKNLSAQMLSVINLMLYDLLALVSQMPNSPHQFQTLLHPTCHPFPSRSRVKLPLSSWLPFLTPGSPPGLAPQSYTGAFQSRRLTEAKRYS